MSTGLASPNLSSPRPPSRQSNWWIWAAKALFSAAVLTAIWFACPRGVERASVLWLHPVPLILAALMRPAFTAVLSWRLYILARRSTPDVPFGELLRGTYIGQMCNQLLPGSIGGDVVRGAIICRRQHAPWQKVASLLLFDRLIGLLSITACVCFLAPAILFGAIQPLLLAVGGLGFVAAGLAWRMRRSIEAKNRFPALQPVFAVASAITTRDLGKATALALAGHAIFLVSNGLIFSAAEAPVSWPVRLGVLALSAFMGNLPLSLGGQGVREGTLMLLLADPFHWWSQEPLASMEVAFVVAAGTWLIHISTSFVGGLIALSIRSPAPPAPLE